MIERNDYLKRLIDRMGNGMIKVITGIRRCGKTYLLFEIFYNYLLENGVDKSHIIPLQLDDRLNIKYKEPDYLCEYVHSQIKDNVQSALTIDDIGKREQKERALLNINDSFRKIIIVRNNIKKWKDDNGTLFLGLKEFLTDPDSIKS